MKPQDIIFLIILFTLLLKGKPSWLILAGSISLLISVPLFHFWVFFTAQRLIYYATAFFLVAIVLLLIPDRRRKERVRS